MDRDEKNLVCKCTHIKADHRYGTKKCWHDGDGCKCKKFELEITPDMAEDMENLTETFKAMSVLGDLMKKFPEVEYDGFTMLSINPLMLRVCTSISDIDNITRRVNEQCGFQQGLAWIPIEGKIPSGDNAVVPCGDAEAKVHRVFRLDHPIYDIVTTLMDKMPQKKWWQF